MRYSFYQALDDQVSVFKLYLQSNDAGPVRCYEFKTEAKGISNEPGVTRLFGQQIFDVAGNYFLFPLDYQGIEIGDFAYLQIEPKFIRVEFMDDENAVLRGVWVLRLLSNGDILFWKPLPAVFSLPTRSVSVSIENGEEIAEIEQQFSIFELTAKGKDFEGIAASEGIWTGQDLHTTLFSKDIIESLFSQMDKNMPDMLVDYDHSFKRDGKLTKVALKEKRGIKFIDVAGEGNLPIPMGSGLSLIIKSKIKWDKNLNVFVLLEAKAVGVSIITKGNPACTICMIR